MSDGTASELYLLVLPYLTIPEPVEFGGWRLESGYDFEGEWVNDRFRELSLYLLGAFQAPDGKPIERPTLLTRVAGGVTGVLPEPPVFNALQRAIHFGSLAANPAWVADDGNEGWPTATSDNSELVAWPIDHDKGRITLSQGSIVRIQAGGYTIGPKLVVPAPLELHLPRPQRFDNEILSATYDVLINDELGDRTLAHRIGVAIDWLAHAWRNSRSISFENRLVMLKTAFDALTGTDETHKAARRLERRFRDLEQYGVNDDIAEELLWSPSEKPRHVREWGDGNIENCTDLMHWFHALGKARNQIVHKGSATTMCYDMKNSAYRGSLVDIGERFLRETIRVCLCDFGFDDLWEPYTSRQMKRTFESSTEDE